MLAQILERLSRPLPAEEQLGYTNTSVVGGLDAHVLALVRRGLSTVESGALPVDCEFPLQRLLDVWEEYGTASPLERQDILDKTRRLLAHLQRVSGEGEANGNAASHLDTPQSLREVMQAVARGETAEADLEEPIALPDSAQNTKPSGPVATLDTDLTYLKGIGPKRAEALAKLGLHTVYDLLYYFPTRYEDRTRVKQIEDLQPGEKESVSATVLYPPETRRIPTRGGQRSLTNVLVGDDSGRLKLSWWNQSYIEKQLQIGTKLFLYGKVGEFGGFLQMETPEFEIVGGDDSLSVGRITPVYPLTQGVFQSHLRKAIAQALEKCVHDIPDPLPDWVRKRFELPDLETALRQIHFPDTWPEKEAARARLVFEELFLLQVALAQKRLHAHWDEVGLRHAIEDDAIKKWLGTLPFKLTGAQRRVMNEIRKDLKVGRPMNRLLHGDVGSGKTIVAAYALWTAQQCGYQGALLAPTEILAEQHFSNLTRLFAPLGIEVALLEGSLSAKQKRRIQADLSEGRVSIVVGTHALIQEGIEFDKLSVCVVDEQHRFGVMQRAALAQKGIDGLRPDVLVMTATPIPRTLALTIYGDLDVSVLDELPPGRQPIKTVQVKPTQRERAYKFIRDEVKSGRQAYVVCPLVEESEKLAQLKAATALAERLREEELHDLRVGLIHGQMDVRDRDDEMERFRAGMLDVLVSTTVIEVGVDVPNATVMVVEDADRFGLSQLHQLRGRVGRGQFKSTCVLLADAKTDVGRARLQAMVKTQNGFEIAEYDLNLRGPGEFYGTRQSGMPDFRLANIIRDVEVIALARDAATELVNDNPDLSKPEYEALRLALRRFWGEKLSLVQVS